MIVCVNPMAADYDETLHVMKFAEMTQEVKTTRTLIKTAPGLRLTPGRRRAAAACKRALEEAAGESTSSAPEDDAPPSPLVYDLGPPLPLGTFDDPSDESYFPDLIDYFQQRARRRATMQADMQRRYDAFRAALVEIEGENTTLRTQVSELQTALQHRDKEISRLKKRLQHAETSTTTLKKNHAEAMLAKKDLETELESKAMKIKQEKDARRRLQEEMASKMALWEKHMSSKHAQELRKQADKHAAEKRAQNQRFNALKEIINSEDPRALIYASSQLESPGSTPGNEENSTPPSADLSTAQTTVRHLVSNFEPRLGGSSTTGPSLAASTVASSESLASSSSGIPATTHPKQKAVSASRLQQQQHHTQQQLLQQHQSGSVLLPSSSTSQGRVRAAADRLAAASSVPPRGRVTAAGGHQRSRSPPASVIGFKGASSESKSIATNRRRSRSQGNNVWLDHRPVPPQDVAHNSHNNESILQPKIPPGEKRVNRRSVTRVEAKDAEKATKYVLTTQRVDSEGEIETQVYKGDVFPTRGGGSEIKMTEVEIHKQRRFSPGSKRSYSASREPLNEDAMDEVESRCNIAIEGHAQLAQQQQQHASKARKN